MSEIGRFEAILLCEDVRREDNGKMIVAGIFLGDVLPKEFPATFPLKLYVHYFAAALGEFELNFRWEIDGIEVAKIEGSVRQETLDTPIALNLPPLTLTFEKPAELAVVAYSGADQRTILRRRVVLQSD